MNYNINTYSTEPVSSNMFLNPYYFSSNNVNDNCLYEARNKYVYINQNFLNGNGCTNTKVLINPNFKQTVHINPNFKKPTKPSIHINPNILRLNENNSVIKPSIQNPSEDKSNNENYIKNQPIISTKTKLIRASAGNAQIEPAKYEGRKSVYSKYKIVHSNGDYKQETSYSTNYLKNKYKIDKNILKTKRLSRKNLVKSKYCSSNIYVNKNKKDTCTKDMKQSNLKYISINGTLYKKTPNVLKKADLVKMTSGITNINNSRILMIRGQLYKLDRRQKTLRMLPLKANSSQRYSIRKDNLSSKQRKLNTSLKLNKSKRKIILSGIEDPTKQILINKMRKCNLPCPVYRKFGKCRRKELGRCIRVHNPDQIMLCAKFLQGACFDSKCLLSHKVSAEKMPTCKYFLEGLCTREDCVYLHVKISAKADICKDFLEGYCKKAKECDKRHQFLCPDYERNGSCAKKRCQYPHGNVVRIKLINKVAKRIVKKKSIPKTIKTKPKCEEKSNEQHDKNVRYYAENTENVFKNTDVIFQDISNDESEINNCDPENFLKLKRTQLGVLPSYIPLGAEDLSSRDIKI